MSVTLAWNKPLMEPRTRRLPKLWKGLLFSWKYVELRSVADHHVVAFEDFVHHGRRGVGGIRIVTVGHDIHVGIDVFEHGANHVALALARLLADDRAFGRRYLGGAVSRVVVIHVNVGAPQCCLEITHYLAYGDFLVVTR